MNRIERTKYILYGLVALGPCIRGAGVRFHPGADPPVKVLVESTRKLKGGELDHRVPHMKTNSVNWRPPSTRWRGP